MVNKFKIIKQNSYMEWIELFYTDNSKPYEFTRGKYYFETGEFTFVNVRCVVHEEIPAFMEFLKTCQEFKPPKRVPNERELA